MLTREESYNCSMTCSKWSAYYQTECMSRNIKIINLLILVCIQYLILWIMLCDSFTFTSIRERESTALKLVLPYPGGMRPKGSRNSDLPVTEIVIPTT